MAIDTLQIANRLKAAERDGRAAAEIALVLGEVEIVAATAVLGGLNILF